MTDSYLTIDQTSRLTGFSYAHINKLLGAQREGRIWKIPLDWCNTHVKPFVSDKDTIDDGYVTAREAADRRRRMADYITTHQAAELTGYSYAYVIKAIAAGKIDGAQRFGDIWQIPLAWAETHKKMPTVTQQAKNAGVSRQTYYNKKKNNNQQKSIKITP